jgi:hypothetical protein
MYDLILLAVIIALARLDFVLERWLPTFSFKELVVPGCTLSTTEAPALSPVAKPRNGGATSKALLLPPVFVYFNRGTLFHRSTTEKSRAGARSIGNLRLRKGDRV